MLLLHGYCELELCPCSKSSLFFNTIDYYDILLVGFLVLGDYSKVL
jgi:hypothetical protein